MNPLIILKTGSTFLHVAGRHGDFEQWIIHYLGMEPDQVRVIDAVSLPDLPRAGSCLGVVITGSHAMVTDREPWSLAVEAWIPELVRGGVPLPGIGYGHQLLASAMGGRVAYLDGGPDVGTVALSLTREGTEDPLFSALPRVFPGHATHAQTAAEPPGDAVILARSAMDPHHAMRIGSCAWGVQFHPEFCAQVMTAYVLEQQETLSRRGRNVRLLLDEVKETPVANHLLRRFAELALKQGLQGAISRTRAPSYLDPKGSRHVSGQALERN